MITSMCYRVIKYTLCIVHCSIHSCPRSLYPHASYRGPCLLISGVSASDREVRVVAVVEPSLLAIFGVVSGFANGVATVRHVAFTFYIALVLKDKVEGVDLTLVEVFSADAVAVAVGTSGAGAS
jgi:hypothetical protein